MHQAKFVMRRDADAATVPRWDVEWAAEGWLGFRGQTQVHLPNYLRQTLGLRNSAVLQQRY
jgi:hypothetical protein